MKRRRFIALPPLLALMPTPAAALTATPAQTTGPFYPLERPLDDDSDLVQVAGHATPARGTVLHLSGTVLHRNGSPAADALVEIWQCDAGGRYHHPGDRRDVAPDPGFQGYGRVMCGNDGGYRFRTIRPVSYPGRTPHIHFAITAAGERPLVTQMYVHGEPGNERDFLYSRIAPALRPRVTVSLQPHGASAAELGTRFDIVLPA